MRLTTTFLATALTLTPALLNAEETVKQTNTAPIKVVGQVSDRPPSSSLSVINAQEAKIADGKLILTGVAASSTVFADRPTRAAGHIATSELVDQWGKGPDSFTSDPPNATVSAFGGREGIEDAVVELRSPILNGTTLTFDVSVLEGNIDTAVGPAAVFIDHGHGWNNAGWYGLGLATAAVAGASWGEGFHSHYYPGPDYYPPSYYPPVVVNGCPPGFWRGPWGECRDTPYHGRLPNGSWQ